MSNLSVYDTSINQWKPQADFLDYCQAGKYSTFDGISFVSSLKFIEKTLLPRFGNINLILGLSDNGKNPIGQFLNGILDGRTEFVETAVDSDAIKDRVLNGSLNFRFTKKGDELIHNKFYLMYNDREYQCFVGSMNLTRSALNKNHEMLIRFAGHVDDGQFGQFKHFWEQSQNWSSGYLDAKHLQGLIGKTKRSTVINVYNDSIDKLSQSKADENAKNVYLVDKDDLKKLRDQGNNQDALGYNGLSAQDKIVIQQVAKLTGDSGALRQAKSLQDMGSEFVQIQQVVSHVLAPKDKKGGKTYLRSAEQMYPSPMMMFNESNDIITMGKDVHHQSLLETKDTISKEDAAIFPEIVKEYQDSKLDGEGHQACDFLLWLFEAPWLWKIQQLYDYNQDSATKPEDVPLQAVLIGVGKTGKSTLASQLGSRLTRGIPQDTVSPDAPEFKSDNGSDRYASKNLNTFVTGYLQAQGPISTMIVDDAPTEYFSKPYFKRNLKGVANKGTNNKYIGPAPTVVYSTNLHDNDNSHGLLMESAILRRCYYLGFDSKFKKGYKNAINDLLEHANNQLYLLVQQRLQEFLVEQPMTDELEKAIEQDYLYPVKTVIKAILDEYGLFNDQLAQYFARNYDFIKDRGKINWYSLVASQTYQKLITFVDNGKTANFPKKIFDDLAGLNSRNNGANWMDMYFNYLPDDSEISSRKSDSGFNVDVKKFDNFIGYPVLEELYQRTDPIAQKVAQGEVTAKVFKRLMEEDRKAQAKQKHHGLLGWLKR